jgi:thiol-disulfide isomerase/thioredoxin
MPEALSIDGAWRVRFHGMVGDPSDAIGEFHTVGDRITGTFLTETGDHRYLSGRLRGDTITLSAFDGAHAFLYRAYRRGDTLQGAFLSGAHWRETWTAVRDPSFHLRDPNSLTQLRPGHDMVEVRATDLDGRPVSSSTSTNSGHVLIVQIMGSWCPNCVDESRLLSELHAQHREKGLDILALAFERQPDTARAIASLRRFRRELGIRYPIAYMGGANKEEAAQRLPFLEQVLSYPTCIFIDRQGKVRRIHTGFSGPGTGSHYTALRDELDQFLQALLADSATASLAYR